MVIPSDQTQSAWCALYRVHKIFHEQVEAELKAANLPPLTWYDVLWELEKTEHCGLRAYELQPKLLLPQYGMSRILTRMEAAGLIRKQECPEDGRGQVLGITEAGRTTRAKMWAIYGKLMHDMLGAKLSDEETTTLAALLNKLAK